MKIRFSLSNKFSDATGRHELLMVATPYVNNRVMTLRARSRIYIDQECFDKSDGIKLHSTYENGFIPDAMYYKEKINTLSRLLSAIDNAFSVTYNDKVTTNFLRNVVDIFYGGNSVESKKKDGEVVDLVNTAEQYIEPIEMQKSRLSNDKDVLNERRNGENDKDDNDDSIQRKKVSIRNYKDTVIVEAFKTSASFGININVDTGGANLLQRKTIRCNLQDTVNNLMDVLAEIGDVIK